MISCRHSLDVCERKNTAKQTIGQIKSPLLLLHKKMIDCSLDMKTNKTGRLELLQWSKISTDMADILTGHTGKFTARLPLGSPPLISMFF